jgi:hypothetical protein
MEPALLIAGGVQDPCLRLLAECCDRKGVPYIPLLHKEDHEPIVDFDLRSGEWRIDKRPVEPGAAFIRMDVFSGDFSESVESLPKSAGWFAWTLNVVSMFPAIRMFNRSMAPTAGLKLADLLSARECGLAVPETLVSNEIEEIVRFAGEYDEVVAKPVNGGGYCKPLNEALDLGLGRDGRMPIPAFIQERLNYPEYRVYRIGGQLLAFRIESTQIDHRISSGSAMTMVALDVEPLSGEVPRLWSMTERLGLDFCAFDLKTRKDGRVCFLEVNTGPMFAAHDWAAKGRLTEMIVEELWRS